MPQPKRAREEVVLLDDDDEEILPRAKKGMKPTLIIEDHAKKDQFKARVEKVTMINFMTYSEVVVHPGNHLNLIVGPNGTVVRLGGLWALSYWTMTR